MMGGEKKADRRLPVRLRGHPERSERLRRYLEEQSPFVARLLEELRRNPPRVEIDTDY